MTRASEIQWRPWSPAAFDEAQKADKPILLRLSAVWCHWCHVMDNTSDRNEAAIRILNEKYVPIRVDIDQNPDVRERYNFGGFPTSAFLTPEGEIITGGTYIPPDEFSALLSKVESTYRTQKSEILERVNEGHDHERTHEPGTARTTPPAEQAAHDAAQRLLDATGQSLLVNFDAEHGGFGSAPKFPHSGAVELALRLHQDSGETEYATAVRKTLDAMRNGELWDREEKAFFRYATSAHWAEPHFEKMLEGNAGLLSNYACAGGALANPEWVRVVADQRSYLRASLQDPTTGLFYGSQDADEEYYALPLDQRSARTAPYVDRTFFTDWNAMMILAYLDAFVASGDPSYRDEALRALDALLTRHHAKGQGFHHYSKPSGPPERQGLFTDQAYAALALLRAHELTGRSEYLERARETFAVARRTMWDATRGRFSDREMTGKELGRVARTHFNVAENGVALRCLVRLAHFTHDPSYEADARTLIASYEAEAERWGIFAAELALGALEFLRGPVVVHILSDAPSLPAFLEEARRIRYPFVMVRVLDGPSGREVAAKQGLQALQPPAAFFCAGRSCSRPFKPREKFAEAVPGMARAART